ncbi:MAG: NRDE family protein [Woeseiaceae bacterium]|nr:NRDE family protein [Woeseiaceae bacterium]
MCLIALALGKVPGYPVVIAANRDEFHARPTQDAHWWPDKPGILGGRDLQAGGTWLALGRNGRFATVTNFRDAQPPQPRHRSRGHLVTDFLDSELAPDAFLATVAEDEYTGFNLIAGTATEVAYLSNREDGMRNLGSGVYGLSNALLDGPWHKVESSKHQLTELIGNNTVNESSLMRLMNDRDRAPVDDIEPDHLDLATAHAISAPFIVLPNYGTRCTTVVLADENGHWSFTERRFDPAGKATGDSRFTFNATEPS